MTDAYNLSKVTQGHNYDNVRQSHRLIPFSVYLPKIRFGHDLSKKKTEIN